MTGDFFTITPSALTTLKHYPSMFAEYHESVYRCSVHMLTPSGSTIHSATPEWDLPGANHAAPDVNISFLKRRPEFAQMQLNQAERLGIPVHWGDAVVAVSESTHSVTVTTASGKAYEAGLCIGANGIGSSISGFHAGPDMTVQDSGYAIARVAFPRSDISPDRPAAALVRNVEQDPQFRTYVSKDVHVILFLTKDWVAFTLTHKVRTDTESRSGSGSGTGTGTGTGAGSYSLPRLHQVPPPLDPGRIPCRARRSADPDHDAEQQRLRRVLVQLRKLGEPHLPSGKRLQQLEPRRARLLPRRTQPSRRLEAQVARWKGAVDVKPRPPHQNRRRGPCLLSHGRQWRRSSSGRRTVPGSVHPHGRPGERLGGNKGPQQAEVRIHLPPPPFPFPFPYKRSLDMASKARFTELIIPRARFQRVSILQQTGFINREELHSVDFEAVEKNPQAGQQIGFFRLGRWVWSHDPAQYARDNYVACASALARQQPFENTNLPPGHVYRPWSLQSEKERRESGIKSDLKSNGDWSI